MAGYSPTALGVLYIALVRNLKKNYQSHNNFKEQITYWAKLVTDLGLYDPDVEPQDQKDPFAASVKALEALYSTEGPRIDAMHAAIADVLTRLSDNKQTGGFRWSNCDFAAFQDIIEIAGRPDIGSMTPSEFRKRMGGGGSDPYKS